jgi:hypothetical protein
MEECTVNCRAAAQHAGITSTHGIFKIKFKQKLLRRFQPPRKSQ